MDVCVACLGMSAYLMCDRRRDRHTDRQTDRMVISMCHDGRTNIQKDRQTEGDRYVPRRRTDRQNEIQTCRGMIPMCHDGQTDRQKYRQTEYVSA